MYIPLGGSQYKFYNAWPIFIFIALWHDLKVEMLAFAFGMSV